MHMFKIFNNRHERLKAQGDSIYIDNSKDNIGKAVELETVFKLTQPTPELKVYENNQLSRLYRIDTLSTNKNLEGQFLHSSIRTLDNTI
jgi:hypothetical protein